MLPTAARSCAHYGPCRCFTPKIQPRLRRHIMRPMFKELFIDADTDDLAAEDDRRRRTRRSGRARPTIQFRHPRPKAIGPAATGDWRSGW